MPFIAICPHCRVCKLRVPRAKRGKTVRCPKCANIFPLLPHDDGAGLVEQTIPAEPSATVSTPNASPAGTSADSRHEGGRLATVSLGAIAVVLVLSQLPYGRVVAVAVALLGAFVGVQSVLETRKRFWLGGLGAASNAFLLIVLLMYPAILGVKGWWPPSPGEIAEANVAAQGIDAGEAAWQHGGVQVAITFATVGPEPASAGGSKEPYFWVGVKIANASAGGDVEFSGWHTTGPEAPMLSTPDQTILGTHRYLGPPGKVALRPGNYVACLLAFDVPPPGQDLVLDLPSEVLGDTGLIRFRIPHELIGAAAARER